jgi:hypothetical protein
MAINIGLVLAAYNSSSPVWARRRAMTFLRKGSFPLWARALGQGLRSSPRSSASRSYRVFITSLDGKCVRPAAPLISTAIMPGFMEELLFRGILFRWIEEFAGSWVALLVTSALFGAHILNPGATWFSSFAIAVEAGLLAWRGLHADAKPVDADRVARRLEFHAGSDFRRAGFRRSVERIAAVHPIRPHDLVGRHVWPPRRQSLP